jgi:hypothetical protein
VADVLVRAGVAPQRIRITACSERGLPDNAAAASAIEGVSRRIEIIVHTVPVDNHSVIAEKEQSDHG